MEDIEIKSDDLVHLARLALSGREQDTATFLHRVARRYREQSPELASELRALLREAPTRSSPLRREAATPVPVDTDSRLALIRVENPPILDADPILDQRLLVRLNQIIDERRQVAALEEAGLSPIRTALLVGPPGVGKTMTARWLALKLGLPLLIIDLSAVMSSLLGKTGLNLRHALDYAKRERCVLLIDELDSVGKSRGDHTDVGELKRLVNVLLQQLDDWPSDGGLLLGATNHPELLDPALWRRFETVLEFKLPTEDQRRAWLDTIEEIDISNAMRDVVVAAFDGGSFSDLDSALLGIRRALALGYGKADQTTADWITDRLRQLPSTTRRELALRLADIEGLSQRRVHEITGVSRDTIRKHQQTKG